MPARRPPAQGTTGPRGSGPATRARSRVPAGCGRGGASFFFASARRIGSPDSNQNSTRSRDAAGSAASRACWSGVKGRAGSAVAGDGTGAGLGIQRFPARVYVDLAGRGSGGPASAGGGPRLLEPTAAVQGQARPAAEPAVTARVSLRGAVPGPTRPPGAGRPSPQPRGPARPGSAPGPYAGSRTAAPQGQGAWPRTGPDHDPGQDLAAQPAAPAAASPAASRWLPSPGAGGRRGTTAGAGSPTSGPWASLAGLCAGFPQHGLRGGLTGFLGRRAGGGTEDRRMDRTGPPWGWRGLLDRGRGGLSSWGCWRWGEGGRSRPLRDRR